ncbi:HNH endonuclease [Segniliparus rotundus DSM 44985]|uniref:HNH endonuclease n=1 Tax=Segniliparus rotundus (strain ATCC BAA-972 / CDC 1076 / CIP 108378 / DSM 44985 / JCM 13578) TaxID=640132 RepID=D6ZAQ9_SEGRD|nr:HNH endonuclease signature motif containing protein [Segniliparus rotundus]ADG98795.1 HNH endonuclease [Segniliparus rotundus DSM 44985]
MSASSVRLSPEPRPGYNRTPDRWGAVPIPARVAERAAKHCLPALGGCWISLYSTASHGYAQIGWQDRGFRAMTTAHRAAWVFFHGQIPLGMTVDHRCKNRRCVNPEHLRLLTNFENARRTRGRDWPIGECAHGHPNSLLRVAATGRTYCSACAEWQPAATRLAA